MAQQMGDYEVVSDTRTPEASLRLLRVRPGHEVQPHYHRKTAQTYVVLTGSVRIQLGDGILDVRPMETVRIPPRTVHALSTREPALVLSIAIPPLDLDDQFPAPRAGRDRQMYGGE